MIREWNLKYPGKYDTVLFDFDGTLVDTNEMVLKSWQHTFKTLLGHEMPEEEILATYGEQLDSTMKKLLPDFDVDYCLKIYRGFQNDNFDLYIKAYEGMFELADKCRDSGIKTAIVTSRHWNEAGHFVDKFKVNDHFSTFITEESCTRHKPDPEPVNLALEALNSPTSTSIMIGDSIHDVECAHNAGVACILMSWSLAYPMDKLEKEGPGAPDYIADSADDIWELLSGLK